jgi:pimeloyl-ACP methyl ester carboxylesterase
VTASPAILATNAPRPHIGATPASRGLGFEDVVLTTRDGLRLAGWYVPSSNRAAVVLLHGAGSTRSNVLDQAEVLARHGFGVLAVDARGHGESGGRAMDFGWLGDADIAAATAFLARRPDVDPERIGAVGLSMGGEEAIGASATDAHLRAVVAEGATARVAADEAWLSEAYGVRGLVQEQLERVQDLLTDALTSASPPISLHEAVERARTVRFLLIGAGTDPEETETLRHLRSAGPDRVETWAAADAGHTEALDRSPDEWEERVISFLTRELDPA